MRQELGSTRDCAMICYTIFSLKNQLLQEAACQTKEDQPNYADVWISQTVNWKMWKNTIKLKNLPICKEVAIRTMLLDEINGIGLKKENETFLMRRIIPSDGF